MWFNCGFSSENALFEKAPEFVRKSNFYRPNRNAKPNKILWIKALKKAFFQETVFSAMRKVVP